MDGRSEDEIRGVIERRIAAMREKDAAGAVAALAEDVVAFELAPPLALPSGAARRNGFTLRLRFSYARLQGER